MIALHISFRLMSIQDYDTILSLWQAAEGVGLSAADERTAIARYLERNPGLSFTAWEGELLVGAVLCGHDGPAGLHPPPGRGRVAPAAGGGRDAGRAVPGRAAPGGDR